jgi:hypothetical protein
MTMLAALYIAAAWVAMEGAKLWWHSRERTAPLFVLVHAALAAFLASRLHVWAAGPAILAVVASFAAIDDKRRGGILGSTLSGLSSYPWQAAAVLSLGLSWGWPAGVLALPFAAITGWIGGMWWVSGMRPAGWTASKQRWAYPRSLRRLLREPNPELRR